MQAATQFQTKILSRGESRKIYQVYRAALEWDLTDPIIIESADDFKSTARWQKHLKPFHHQVTNLITFCRRLPVTLLADDVGLGKTVSAGLIISELVARAKVSRVLIVCPKVLCQQWKQELESKFAISSTIATGRDLLKSTPDDVMGVITTYNSARLYLERIPEDRFEMLILDEAHKLRNLYGTPNTPQVAKTFHKALADRRFRFVLMLTATPIQNRLWDLYSLVDLLTVARGHDNPFGTPGMFVRRFVADEKEKARQLKSAARDEFRAIVSGYMSRVRRGDAKLSFPDRVVQMHRVNPTPAELGLIRVIAKPIQNMNRLVQINILQALMSSPHALAAQLKNMARNGTAPSDLAQSVSDIVERMPPSAKLNGLGTLIEQLKRQNASNWRLVVFTTRRETQTTIQNFLEGHGLKVGLINGDSGQRNQETIDRFWQDPPGCRVIVSTEAGSEGVNLQVANVLVNYDLPWNPMIVEQRVGRVQRLGSNYAHVSIFNITLQGTFEEYIVGRLMEKLQMAAHAIGDIESLLQGSDVGNSEEDAGANFEDLILDLVLSALAGKNVEEDVRLKTISIENAKRELESEEANMNAMLGGMDGGGYSGPRSPKLPAPHRSMTLAAFTLSAFEMLGATVSEQGPGIYLARERGGEELIGFEGSRVNDRRLSVYTPQSPAFQRLVKRVVASGVHNVEDADTDPGGTSKRIVSEWFRRTEAKITNVGIFKVTRCYNGEALLRVRVTTAHDSYERLVTCTCGNDEHRSSSSGEQALAPLEKLVREPASLGIDTAKLQWAAGRDDAVAEFSRFYLERGAIEMQAAGGDERKRQKLKDDFTPRLDVSLVGLEGSVRREVVVRANYTFPSGGSYEADFIVRPSSGQLLNPPETARCSKSGNLAPKTSLARCDASGAWVLSHLLVASEIGRRRALPEFIATCSFSGKTVLIDEMETSSITGRPVAASLLLTSALSGARAEPDQFARCAFTGANLLKRELAVSELSGKSYRIDEKRSSDFSGKTGHRQEFITCSETRQTIATFEAETCEQTQSRVRPGVLTSCEVTEKRVLPSVTGMCSVTNKRVLKKLLVSSNISFEPMLRNAAVVSLTGKFCLPKEAETCFWSGRISHPEDLRTCGLTGLQIHVDFSTAKGAARLRPLVEMLDGMRRNADEPELWAKLSARFSGALKGAKCRIESALLSPSKRHIAICLEAKTMLGLRVQQVGAIYDLGENAIVGRLAEGKRNATGWVVR